MWYSGAGVGLVTSDQLESKVGIAFPMMLPTLELRVSILCTLVV